MRIAIASDHAAVDLKAQLGRYIALELGHDVTDIGPGDPDPVDYPDYGYRLAEMVGSGEADFGVGLCGSGIGIAIAINRDTRVRCALVSEPLSARLARSHNDANIIAMGARLIGLDMAKACIDAFLTTEFLGDRHARRVAMLAKPPFSGVPA